jgi:hypothetical protein
MALWDSFVSRTMSAILSDFHFTFDAACVAQMPLRVFAEPQSSVIQAVKPEVIDSRSLVDLYDELLSASDKEKRVSMKTIRDNRAALDKFEVWGRMQHRVVAGRSLSLLEQPKILRTYAEVLRAQPKGNSSAMASKALSSVGKLAGACVRAGMHMMPPGGFLGRHLDAECHPIRPWRRTHSIVLGVNSAWGELCGGELVIEPDTIIGVKPGRAVIFETAGTWHQVNRVNTDVSGLYRKTLALFAWQIDHNCDGGTSANFSGA